MKVLLAILGVTLLSTAAFAKQQKVLLTQAETQAMIQLFNRAGIKGAAVHGVCFMESAVISSVIHNMGPAHWVIIGAESAPVVLNAQEIPAAIQLFNRIGAKGSFNGVSSYEKVTVSSIACEMSPATWSVTFEDGQP